MSGGDEIKMREDALKVWPSMTSISFDLYISWNDTHKRFALLEILSAYGISLFTQYDIGSGRRYYWISNNADLVY